MLVLSDSEAGNDMAAKLLIDDRRDVILTPHPAHYRFGTAAEAHESGKPSPLLLLFFCSC